MFLLFHEEICCIFIKNRKKKFVNIIVSIFYIKNIFAIFRILIDNYLKKQKLCFGGTKTKLCLNSKYSSIFMISLKKC